MKLSFEQVLELEKCKRYLAENPDKAAETASIFYKELLITQNAYNQLYEKYTLENSYQKPW